MPLGINLYASDFCFSRSDTQKLVVELEKGRLCEKQILLYDEGSKELQNQLFILKEELRLTDIKFKECTDSRATDKVVIDGQKKQINEASKPKWSQLFGSFGVGAITTLILVILL